MLLSTTMQIKLSQKYEKILHFYPAFDETFVLLAIKQNIVQVLAHINSKGQVIKQKIFYNTDLEQMGMISDRQVLVLNVKDNTIIQWNLETGGYIQFPYLYKQQDVMNTCELFIFPQTSSFCIVELGGLESNFFRLSYFRFPLKVVDQQPFIIFQDQSVWNYRHVVRKANNHSMICWFEGQKDQQIVIKMFDFKQQSEGQYNEYFFSQLYAEQEQIKTCEVSLCNLWEVRPQQLLLVCLTNVQLVENHMQYPNSNFIVNLIQKSIREVKFTFPGKYQNQLIDNFWFGATSMFRSYDFQKGKQVLTPIYYINNYTEQIIATQQWTCSYRTKYQQLPYSTNTLFQCEYENGHVDQILVKFKQIKNTKLIMGFLVTELIQNCDQDLLLQIIKLNQ